jgi:hypothetical protein
MRRLIVAFVLLAGCDKPVPPVVPLPPIVPSTNPVVKPPEGPAGIDLQLLGGFEYKEKMELPADVMKWNGRRVRATGFINPTTQQIQGMTNFLLVKDRSACCFGKRPQINHYLEVTLVGGKKINYSQESVTVVGTLKIEDRWDGDWQLGLYWIDDGEIATH